MFEPLQNLLSELSLLVIVTIAFIALITSAIHGATGLAGGFLLAAAMAPVIGVKPIVPVISVALLISHFSRTIFNIRDFSREIYLGVVMVSIPCVVIGAFTYGHLSSPVIAALLGCVILISIPIRHWARNRSIKTTKPVLRSVAAVYGGLAGTSIGPGSLLAPFILGYGITKEAFVATMAAIALTTNITRVSVFGVTDLLGSEYLLLGVLVGLVTIPGNWIGRSYLRSMTNEHHSMFVDILIIIGAANFFWLAFRVS